MFDVFSQKNRILLRELIKTDFKLRYQGSAIGYLWSILKPLMTFTSGYAFLLRRHGPPHHLSQEGPNLQLSHLRRG